MGHYDDAREAHEAAERRRSYLIRAKHFKAILENRTDEELGNLLAAYERMMEELKGMQGTRSQHISLMDIQRRIDEFHRRR